mgnify:CR=1 FL=1
MLALSLLVAGAEGARADLIAHNGTAATGGLGLVNVDLLAVDPPGEFIFGTTFHEVAAHSFLYAYDIGSEPPVVMAEFAVQNNTGQAWHGFRMLLIGADLHGINGSAAGASPARSDNPVVFDGTGADEIAFRPVNGFSFVLDSSLTRANGNALLEIRFLDPVSPNESFQLAFQVDNFPSINSTQFVLMQRPVIPEPGATVLALQGAALLLLRRRPS